MATAQLPEMETPVNGKHELIRRWREARKIIKAGSYPTAFDEILARLATQTAYLEEIRPLAEKLQDVSVWNIMTILLYLSAVAGVTADRIAEIGQACQLRLQEILTDVLKMKHRMNRIITLQEFTAFMSASLREIGRNAAQTAFTMGAWARRNGSHGPISQWILFVKNCTNSFDSLFVGPIKAAIRIGIWLSRLFNDTKDSVIPEEGRNYTLIVHWYKPWVDLLSDWFSIPFTNGHLADIIAIFYWWLKPEQLLGRVKDLMCQWHLVDYLRIQGFQDAVLRADGAWIGDEKVADYCSLQPFVSDGQPVYLPANRDLSPPDDPMPYYNFREVGRAGQIGWAALRIIRNFPENDPVVWEGQIFDAPYHLTEIRYQEVPALLRPLYLLIGMWNRFILPFFTKSTDQQLVYTAHTLLQAESQRADSEADKAEAAVAALDLHQKWTSGMSHDLGNTLTVLTGNLELVDKHFDALLAKPAELRDLIICAKKGARYTTMIFEGLLEKSKLVAGRSFFSPKPVALRLTLESVCDLLTSIKEVNRSIAVDCPEITLVADKKMLPHILVNPIGNAIKYSSEGAGIAVKVAKEKEQVLIAVLDQGFAEMGLSHNQATQLFKPWVRLDIHADKPGTGLGLVFSQQLTQLHGGEIYIEGFESGAATSPRYRTTNKPEYPWFLDPNEPYRTAFVVVLPLKPTNDGGPA